MIWGFVFAWVVKMSFIGLTKYRSKVNRKLAKKYASKDGRSIDNYGTGVKQPQKLDASDDSLVCQSNFNSPLRKLPSIYYERQVVSMFGRTEKTATDILRFERGALTKQIAFGGNGLLSVKAIVTGVIVGGDENGIGEVFQKTNESLFRFDNTSVTQVGTTGGKITSDFADSNVGIPVIYVSYDNSAESGGKINFLISNTGNRITEWTAEVTLRLQQSELYQGLNGGALWQNSGFLVFQDRGGLLWN